jgi:HAMP domain-containing protein
MSTIDRVLMGVLLAVGLIVVGAVAWVVTSGLDGGSTALERAADECSTDDLHLVTGDDGNSLRLIGLSDQGIAVMSCVFDYLDAPDSLIGKLQDTRGLDGRQEDSWGDYKASWTFLPDDGYHVVIEAD